MSLVRLLTVGSVASVVAGCAVRPLPQDVTKYDTYEIVAKVRCEAREAIGGFVIEAIKRRGQQYPQDLVVAQELESKSITFAQVDIKRLHPITQKLFKIYGASAIAYDFRFDIDEMNNASASLDFAGAVTRGTVNLGLTAGSKLERENTRTFRISDTFEHLLTEVTDDYCNPYAHVVQGRQTHPVYPITGYLGLAELIKTFLDLNQSGNLSFKDEKSPTVTDDILFTTTVNAGTSPTATPTIQLTPVTRAFQLVRGNVSIDAMRKDIHRVTIGLSLPVQQPAAKQLAHPLTARYYGRKTAAEVRALDAVELAKTENRLFRISRVLQRLEDRLGF